MGELIGLMKAFEGYPIVQVAVAGVIFLVGVRMITKAGADKAAQTPPPPAAGDITNTNLATFSGGAAMFESFRAMNEHLRDLVEHTRQSNEIARRNADHAEEHTSLLREIERRQAITAERDGRFQGKPAR